MSQAKQKIQIDAVNAFINEKIGTTYIVIDPIFADCDFENPKWLERIRK